MKTILILMAVALALPVAGAVLATPSVAHTAMINTLEDTQPAVSKKQKVIAPKKHRKHFKKGAR